MPIVAIIGSLILIAVTLAQPGRRANLWVFVGFLVAVPVLLVSVAPPVTGRATAIYPEARSEQLLRAVVPDLQRVADDPPSNVIIIEGGSWSSRGVDGTNLESELARHGVDAAVIQLTLPGANHFERDYILRTAADSLDTVQMENLAETDVIMLREISRTYDEQPAFPTDRNLFTDRVYAYSTPARGLAMAQGALASGDLTPQLAVEIAQHVAFNWLHIGEAQRLSSEYANLAQGGYQPLDATDEELDTEVIAEVIEAIETERTRFYAQPQSVEIIETLSDDLFGLPIDFMVSFELPALRIDAGSYARWIAGRSNHATIILDDTDLYRSLDDPTFWRDTGHLSRQGAEIYTAWLATRIAELLHPEA